MLVEMDTKYKKICKKNNYDPENEDVKKGKEEIITTEPHSTQANMVLFWADATYEAQKRPIPIKKRRKYTEQTKYSKHVTCK